MTKTRSEQKTPVAVVERPTPLFPIRSPFFEGWFDRLPAFTHIPGLWSQMGGESIPVEEFVEDDSLVIRAELPGIDADEDIEIDVDKGRLSIRACRERREEFKDDRSFRSEFHYGSFQRTMMLPAGTDADDVKAVYEDGILEVRVPIDSEEAEPKKIEISHQ